MLEQRKTKVSWYGLDYHIKEKSGKNLSELTKEELVELLFGNYNNDYRSDFIIKCYNNYSKRTLWNRLNLMWIYPLFIIALPFQYLITGDTGINRNTKIGRVVDRLVKFE